MRPRSLDPDQPRAWLERARSDLRIARADIAGVRLEDLCYHAQQAAEKALKAVLLKTRGAFPYVHDLARLISEIQREGIDAPASVVAAVELTTFAVEGRYPGFDDLLTEDERFIACNTAEATVSWAESIIEAGRE